MPREKKQKLKKRPDGRYVCRYHDQWFYSTDPDDCLRQREQYKAQERRGMLMAYFVREYAEGWFARSFPNVTPSTRQGYKIHLETLLAAIGHLPLADVKPSDIKSVYSTHYNGLSNSYIKAARQLYCALFDSAVADGYITANPARDKTAKPHKGKTGGHRAITEQERYWIENLCTEHRAHPVAMLMLYAGLRPQEAKALNIDTDIDFEKEIIHVRNTAHIHPDNGQKYAISAHGKTERAVRRVPLLKPLKAALSGRQGHICASAHGEPINRTTWRVLWNSYRNQMEKAINGIDKRWYGRTRAQRELAARGELPPWIPFTVTPYDLRHSFATMCRNCRPPIELHTVIAWMGHADARMVLHVYDSVTTERDEAEAARLKMTTGQTTKP